jgi:hypothetical protein
MRRLLCTCCASLVAALLAFGGAHGETIAPAATGPEFRQDAASAIPFDQLTEEARAKIGAVVARPTIFRRLPAESIACDAEMYLLLVRNPDIVVNIWQLMGVTDVTMDRSAPYTYTSDDKAGTLSQIELLYGTPTTHIYYAATHYEGPLFARPVNARVVLLLRSEYTRGEDGTPRITSVMDAFIRIDHLTANLVARTFSKVVGKTADHNFVESFRFVSRVSKTAEENGPGVAQLAMKLERVDAQVRQQFADVAGAAAERAVQRAAAHTPANDAQADGIPATTSTSAATIAQPSQPPAERGAAATRALQLRR